MTKYYPECKCDKKCPSSKFRSCPAFKEKKQKEKDQKKANRLARQRQRYAEQSPSILMSLRMFKHYLRLFSIMEKADWKSSAESCMEHYAWWLYHKYRHSTIDVWRSVPVWGTVDKAAEQMGVPFAIGKVQFKDEVFVQNGPELNEQHIPCFRYLAILRVRHENQKRASMWRAGNNLEDVFSVLDETVRRHAKRRRDELRAIGQEVTSSSSSSSSEEEYPEEQTSAAPVVAVVPEEEDELAPIHVPPLRDPAIRYGNAEQYSDYVSSIYQADRIEAHQRAVAENARREEERILQAHNRHLAAQRSTITAAYFKKKQEEEEKKAPVPPPPQTPLPPQVYKPFVAPKPLQGMSATTMAALVEKEKAEKAKQANIAAVVAAGEEAVIAEEHCQVLRQLVLGMDQMTNSIPVSAFSATLFSSARWGGNFASQDAIRARLYAVVELLPAYFSEQTKGGISYVKKVGRLPPIPTLEAELRSALRSTR